MSDPRALRPSIALTALAVGLASCFAGTPVEPPAPMRNGSSLSAFGARDHAGGKTEGPMGRRAAVSYSQLWDDLARDGIVPTALGPLNRIADQRALLAVMKTFTRSLGVQCEWCHRPEDYAAPTPRKAAAAYMWDRFVQNLELHDGSPLYCDSCHHESNIFLDRNLGSSFPMMRFMQVEYVNQLRRRDGAQHGCATCHGTLTNLRFLPRLAEPADYTPPIAHPGPHS